jgi:hypothetical protein
MDFAVELRRRQQLGTVASIDSGRMTLADYVTSAWAPTAGIYLSEITRRHYSQTDDKHILPVFGSAPLRELSPDMIARWQPSLLASGAGPVAVRKAMMLLGAILQRAVEADHLARNPARLVRKVARRPLQYLARGAQRLARCRERHQELGAPHCTSAGAARGRSTRMAASAGPPRRSRACVPVAQRRRMAAHRLRLVEGTCVPSCQPSRWRSWRPTV